MPATSLRPFDVRSFSQTLLTDLQPFLPDRNIALPLPGAGIGWQEWLRREIPTVCSFGFAKRHVGLWDWAEDLRPGVKPRPRVEVWPRGGAKSSTGELICARLGVKLTRRFVLYVSATQDQADLHVQAIASHFETLGVGRAISKYGASKGWRRNQLRTENGYNVAAFGLDGGTRGIKIDAYRPDLIIFDDVDNREDSEATVAKKVRAITLTIMPAGSGDCAYLFLQNLIHKDSVAAQLVDGRADFLHNREVPTVEPAVVDLEVDQVAQPDGTFRYRITGGTPTWEGQDIATCEAQINEWGLHAFNREAQQQVEDEEGGLWSRELLARCRATSHPELIRVGVAIDPNASEGGDQAGIVVGGVGYIEGTLHGFLLEDATMDGGPKAWAEAAVAAYNKHEADVMLAEVNNGGDMVGITIGTIDGAPRVKKLHASRGKLTRAEPVQKLYEDGRIHHVGHFSALETELCTYKPGMPSPNRLDANVWLWTELMTGPPKREAFGAYR